MKFQTTKTNSFKAIRPSMYHDALRLVDACNDHAAPDPLEKEKEEAQARLEKLREASILHEVEQRERKLEKEATVNNLVYAAIFLLASIATYSMVKIIFN